MAMRMVLELGALWDALSHNSLSIATALGQPPEAMTIDVHMGVPRPDKVNEVRVLAALPHRKGTVTVVDGDLEVHDDVDTASTLIADACAIVSLDIQ
jgi:hypothetical protein